MTWRQYPSSELVEIQIITSNFKNDKYSSSDEPLGKSNGATLLLKHLELRDIIFILMLLICISRSAMPNLQVYFINLITQNRLKINSVNIKLILTGTKQQQQMLSRLFRINILGLQIILGPTELVRNLFSYSELSLLWHVSTMCNSAFTFL